MTTTSPADTEPVSPPLLCRRVERRDPDASGSGDPGSGSDEAGDDESRTTGTDGIADTITLDETDRHRRRMAMISDGGIAFVLSLDATVLLRDGDRLVLDDDRRIVVRAAPEALHEVRGGDPHHLLRLAWHMGNRHLPTQLMDDHLRIRRDEVIAAMLRGLGADVRDIEAGFDPEGGAYDEPGGPSHRGGRGSHHHHHD